jgi:hypothetical protein
MPASGKPASGKPGKRQGSTDTETSDKQADWLSISLFSAYCV